MHNFRELLIWKNSRILVKEVYLISKSFPDEERFGLTSQMRRSAISIPSNIAQGSGRSTKKDFANFLSISISSAFELETQILLAHDLNYINEDNVENLNKKLIELQKMIFGFRQKILELETTNVMNNN